jgi:predicted nucleotidyltransferase
MRLSEKEKDNLLNSIHFWDRDAKVYLFGSRTSDKKKGGDIDLAVWSDRIGLKEKIDIKLKFFEEFGEQKIDLFVFNDESNTFWNVIQDDVLPLELINPDK